MRTPRDVVAEPRTGTRSVRNSLTAMTRVTGVGTVTDRADRAPVSQMCLGGIVATAILTATGPTADVVIVTAIGVTIGIGVAAANGKDCHS